MASDAVALQPQTATAPTRAERRAALLMARFGRTATPGSSTVLIGAVWSSTDEAMAGLGIQLRDLSSGDVVAASVTDANGQFGFQDLPAGAYLIEVTRAPDDETVVAIGQAVTVVPGETVATFVRLPPPTRWADTATALLGGAGTGTGGAAAQVGSSLGTFGGTAASVLSTATSAGLTGLANFGFDASAER
jgi:hypothetical protein